MLDDVVVELAREVHAHEYVQDWVPFHFLQRAFDPAWTYRLFPWDKIIQRTDFHNRAAVAAGKCEGLIAITRGAELKVEFLATAPWNFAGTKRRKGVGTGLLSYAVNLADVEGFSAVTLSSTPESETYYSRLNWARTGDIDREGLAVFQLTADRFEFFLNKYPPLTKKEQP